MRSILLAGGLGMLGTLLGTRFAIAFLVTRGYGQFIRDDGPTSHHTKRGTPTMGGIVIIISVLVAYAVAHLVVWTAPSVTGLLVLGLFTALGPGRVGSTTGSRSAGPAHSGLNSTAKLVLPDRGGDHLRGSGLPVPRRSRDHSRDAMPSRSCVTSTVGQLPVWLAVIWIILIVAAASNGVNLTDGLDGLATGASAMVFAALRRGEHLAVQPVLRLHRRRPAVLRGPRPVTTWRWSRSPSPGPASASCGGTPAGQDLHG